MTCRCRGMLMHVTNNFIMQLIIQLICHLILSLRRFDRASRIGNKTRSNSTRSFKKICSKFKGTTLILVIHYTYIFSVPIFCSDIPFFIFSYRGMFCFIAIKLCIVFGYIKFYNYYIKISYHILYVVYI
jgi:hypothetical protein